MPRTASSPDKICSLGNHISSFFIFAGLLHILHILIFSSSFHISPTHSNSFSILFKSIFECWMIPRWVFTGRMQIDIFDAKNKVIWIFSQIGKKVVKYVSLQLQFTDLVIEEPQILFSTQIRFCLSNLKVLETEILWDERMSEFHFQSCQSNQTAFSSFWLRKMTVKLFSVFGDTHQQEKDRKVFDSALAAAWSFVQIFIFFLQKRRRNVPLTCRLCFYVLWHYVWDPICKIRISLSRVFSCCRQLFLLWIVTFRLQPLVGISDSIWGRRISLIHERTNWVFSWTKTQIQV